MSIETITWQMLGLLSLQLLIGVPFAVATGLTAAVTAVSAFGPQTLLLIASRIFDISDSFALLAVPMFVLMGNILEKSGVAEKLFAAMHLMTGRLPGGLAVSTVLAATVMSAMVGVVGAEVVMLGLVALPAMLRRSYDKRLAVGVIVAGGSLGTMMPPSLFLVVYGLIANVSISDLFLAAFTPALLLASLYSAYVMIRCKLDPNLAPRSVTDHVKDVRPLGLRDRLVLLMPALIVTLVMGSLYAGIATPTEAASLGVLGAVIAAACNGRLNFSAMWDATRQTGRAIGPVVWIFFGANAMVNVYALAGGIEFIKSFFLDTGLPPLALLFAIMGFLFVLGLFIDWIGIAFLTMPVFVPLITELGMSPIWFGILFCMNMQMSYITPPFGPACFYLKGVAPPEISLTDIFRSVGPFVVLQAIAVVLVLLFPSISMWPLIGVK
jgi:tripartite ATP-independent transporter DctM subunit|uniref:TRAP transporter large permease n=1 Tax=Limnohabitans sp. TaxID=1907725 RepID=UPI0040484762